MPRLSFCALLIASAMTLDARPSITVVHDNAHVRVSTMTMQPGERVQVRGDGRNRVLAYLDTGRVSETIDAGQAEAIAFRAGDVRWLPASGDLVRVNVTDRPVQIVEIALTGKPQPAAAPSDLDPLAVDPTHWTLLLENAYVRVARVRFGPREKGVRHQHVRNYLAVYMTDQAKGVRGQVNLHLDEGVITHAEDNPLDRPVERIVVELK